MQTMQYHLSLWKDLAGWILPALIFWAVLSLVDRSQDLELHRSPAGRPGTIKAHAASAVTQPPNAFPNALRIPFVIEDGESYCNLGLNNLSDSLPTIRISFRSLGGASLGVRTPQVTPHGMIQINRVVSFLLDVPMEKAEGHLILESDQDSRAWVSFIDRQSLDSNIVLASDETSNRILIPSSVNSERYRSSLVVVNTSEAGSSLKITVRNAQGTVLGTRNEVPIAAHGLLHFKDVYQAIGMTAGTNAFGPIEIESVNGCQMQAVLLIRTSERTGGFLPGVNLNQGARRLFVPYAEDSLEIRTNLGLNNPGTATASVSVSLVTPEGVSFAPRNVSLPPNSLTQLDSVVRLLGNETTQKGWIRISADQDVFAWVSLIDNQTQDPALSVAATLAATKWLIPSATGAGSFKSSLMLANLDVEPAQVDMTVRDSKGAVMKSMVMTVAPSGMFVSQDVLASLGLSGRFGPIEITSPSGKPLLATSRVVSGQHTGSAFSAVPLESQRKVLYLTHSAGFQHGVLPLSESVLREVGATSRAFEVAVERDSVALNRENLRDYDAVVFYTSGELPLSDVQKDALLDFIRSGKGFTGIHSATDTLYSWPEFGELVGGYFDGHP